MPGPFLSADLTLEDAWKEHLMSLAREPQLKR